MMITGMGRKLGIVTADREVLSDVSGHKRDGNAVGKAGHGRALEFMSGNILHAYI